MSIHIDQILAANSWSDLGLPHDKKSLRELQKKYHPDINRDFRASQVFEKVQELFIQTNSGSHTTVDFDVRVATGKRLGNGQVEWKVSQENQDLAQMSDMAHHLMGSSIWTTSSKLGTTDLTRIITVPQNPSEQWWFMKDFPKFDERSAVWIIKRLLAIANVCYEKQLVHPDVSPAKIVVFPADHGLKLDGWWGAVRAGDPLVISPDATTPTAYLHGKKADSLMQVSQSVATVLEKSTVTGELKSALTQLMIHPKLPTVAFAEIDKVAIKLFGPPSWHPLQNPKVPSL